MSQECSLVLKVVLEADQFPRLGCPSSLHETHGSALKSLAAGLRLLWQARFLTSFSSLWFSWLVSEGWLDHQGHPEYWPSP